MASSAIKYLKWKEEKIKDNSPENISSMYDNGFVFTRIDKDMMHQTRSIRIDLDRFELSSENRRILRKGESISIIENIIPYSSYSWEIGKIGKDFYESRKADFSANKIKELIIDNKSNFNLFFNFSDIGYAICYINNKILHYSYPFYNLKNSSKDKSKIKRPSRRSSFRHAFKHDLPRSSSRRYCYWLVHNDYNYPFKAPSNSKSCRLSRHRSNLYLNPLSI